MDIKSIKTTRIDNLIIDEVEESFETDQAGKVKRKRFYVGRIVKLDPAAYLKLHEFDKLEDAKQQVEFMQRSK